jgi:CHAD domain-containing protein
MSERRVRYWLAEWRQKRLGIFPEKLLAQLPPAPESAAASPAPSPSAPTAAAEVAPEISPPPAPPAIEGDVTHIEAVMAHADRLFELLQPWHGLAPEDRRLLREIARLHDIGVSLDPERHAVLGYERLTAQPPAHLTPAEAQFAALATLLHSDRLKARTLQTLLDRTEFQTMPLEQQHRALVLTALLRMADGLDFRHTASTHIVALEAGQSPCREILLTVAGPVAGSDAERANFKADLWARIFNQPVRFQTPPLDSTALLAHLLHLPTEAGAPESLTLPTSPGITPEDTLTEAARKTFLFHFQRMLYLEPETRRGEDNEALHDMRVATRRMRTAAQVFSAHLDTENLRPFVKGLRTTGDALGAVRDLDVFWEKTEAFLSLQETAARPDLTPLHQVWQQARARAREEMLAHLDSPRYRRFRERFAAYLETPWAPPYPAFNLKGEALPQQVRHVAPILIAERVAAIRAYDPWLRGADIPLGRYHRLRIASKRLRYTLEYFSEVLGPAAKPLITQVKLLQDHLGELQDAVVASNLLRDFLVWGTWGHTELIAVPLEPIVAPGVASYLTERQLELQQRRDSFLPLWDSFNGAETTELIANVITAL